MKRKFIVLLGVLCFYCFHIFGQTAINEKITPKPGQKIQFFFKYPELVKLTTWDKNEIEISGSVRINNGRNDDAFALEVEDEGDVLMISSTIKNLENLPKMMMIKRGDMKYYFDNVRDHDEAVQRLKEEHGESGINYSTHGVIKEITLEIKMPANSAFSIESKFGLLEMRNVKAPIKAVSKFGGIDISLSPGAKRDIELSTKFGEVFTNLNLDIKEGESYQPHKWNTIHGKLNGGGEICQLESKFGNIYLRKSQ